jgi:outer membrane immunogenic protein
MKIGLLAGATVLALGIASASAADIGRRPPPPPAYTPPPVYNWTGFYAGINGGGAIGHSSLSNALGSQGFNVDGGLVGGTLGYNYQVGQWVFGLEGDADWAGNRGDTNSGICAGLSCSTKNFDRFLPYVTGGGAFGNIKTEVAGFPGRDETQAGWTVGGGLEAAIAGPWTAKIEYLYVDLGKDTCGAPSCGTTTLTNDFHTNVIRAGLNYRF